MPWYLLIDDEMDVCDPDSYVVSDHIPDCEAGPYLHAIFAEEYDNDPNKRPNIDGTPGLLYYLIRAIKSGRDQPSSILLTLPIEVKMSSVKANNKVKNNFK